jgi:MFS transporter, DHA3 family, macrolide efflux protein
MPSPDRDPAPAAPMGVDAAPVAGGALKGVPHWRRAVALLWLGQVVSHLGDSLFLGSIVFLGLEVTGSESKSGLLMATNFLPALALGLIAGAFVDRHDRRRVMIGADLLRALAVGAIPILHGFGHLGTPALAGAVFCLSLGTTVFNPAIKALLPEMVPLEHLTGVVSMFQISEYIALVAGPALASLAPRDLGMIHMFSVDAATFVFSAACLALLPRETRRHMHVVRPTESLLTMLPSLVREAGVGLRAVRDNPVLRVLLALAALDNLFIMGLAYVGTPVLVKTTLHLDWHSNMQAQATLFLGLALASAAFWAVGRRWPKGRVILIGIALDGLTFLPVALCRTLPQVQLALFLHAISIPLIIIPRTVLIQQTVPGPLLGRTFALMNMTVFGMTAISSALVGTLAEHVSPQALFVTFGLLGALPGLLGFAFPALRAAR